MSERSYVVAGWMAIASAILIPPTLIVGIILEVALRKNPGVAAALLLPYAVTAGAQTFLGIFAFGRFKTLLNERHRFHQVDGLIVALIVGTCVMTLTSIGVRGAAIVLGTAPELVVISIALLVGCGLPLAILSVVFAVKLLRLESDLGGLLKPYAYTTIAAVACFATFILAPLGLLIDAAVLVMLGMIFLRKQAEELPEFV